MRCVKWATVPPGPHSPGESPRRGGGPPISEGSVGRAEPLRRVLWKGEGLRRERSSAGNGAAIIPRCVVCLAMTDDRNPTSHAYIEAVAVSIFRKLPAHHGVMRRLLMAIQERSASPERL